MTLRRHVETHEQQSARAPEKRQVDRLGARESASATDADYFFGGREARTARVFDPVESVAACGCAVAGPELTGEPLSADPLDMVLPPAAIGGVERAGAGCDSVGVIDGDAWEVMAACVIGCGARTRGDDDGCALCVSKFDVSSSPSKSSAPPLATSRNAVSRSVSKVPPRRI